MKKVLVRAAAVAGALVIGTTGAAMAAPNYNGACRQAVRDIVVASSEEGTMGDAISDGFYGNEPNEVDGHTVPSQSPGLLVTDRATGEVSRGGTWGDVQQNLIKPACNG